MSNFRENLRNELDFQDIKVKELSEKCGIPKATLECYLRAQSTEPSAENAVKIARALKVSVEYLVMGENKNTGKPRNKPSREAQEIIRWVGNLSHEQCRAVLKVVRAFEYQKIQR
ncbi:MAG: helix-turn-helix domain-containing protein [Clostridiales bacterium]|jgi:transcriptional regulator with XRE-family HTH domain|nr:helix-turn-helix domain-containing protein [Clostridiales bacterium]